MNNGTHCDYCGQHTKDQREFLGHDLCRQCYREVMDMVRETGSASWVNEEMEHENFVSIHASALA